MKLTLNQEVSISLNPDYIPNLSEDLKKLLNEWGESQQEEVCETLLTILFFRKLEKDNPGTVDNLLTTLRRIK